ncbi:dUTP diphosphatase [uncultured Sphingomonas sp.]|uniref:dUTP diphosphatase n=1 Tax=uncultured Sphingomonas sp. TaxID=158754 RepID=UPI002593765F|nr:dUTP diphosphatase [uncultured Sphingomonas sp.]
MHVRVKRLTTTATLPVYATPGAACFDLHADHLKDIGGFQPVCTDAVSTGLAFEIPQGHVMLIFSRSGDGFKRDVRLSNCVGVIDSDYRGDVAVKLRSDNGERVSVQPGDRVAQALILPVEQVNFVDSFELSDTERGSGSFGSTGK